MHASQDQMVISIFSNLELVQFVDHIQREDRRIYRRRDACNIVYFNVVFPPYGTFFIKINKLLLCTHFIFQMFCDEQSNLVYSLQDSTKVKMQNLFARTYTHIGCKLFNVQRATACIPGLGVTMFTTFIALQLIHFFAGDYPLVLQSRFVNCECMDQSLMKCKSSVFVSAFRWS